MKSLFLALTLLASASAEFLVPAWTAEEEAVLETRHRDLTASLRNHCIMVGRLGLSEIRPAVIISENGDILAPYLRPIDADDEAPYLLHLPDGSRRTLETIAEKSERGIALLRGPLPPHLFPVTLAPDQTIIKCHWFLFPVTAPLPKIGEPIAFASDHLFPRPAPEAVSFLLDSRSAPAGTPVFDLAGRLTAITTPTPANPGHALLISRLAEDLEDLHDLLPDPTPGSLPRLPLAPKLAPKSENDPKKQEPPTSPLKEAREIFARSLMPNSPPYALVFNNDGAITHSISAVIIRSDGLLLTKASELGPTLTVRYQDQSYPAALLATDEASDLALIGISAKNLPVIQWSSPHSLTPGATILSPILIQPTSQEMAASDAMALGQFSHPLSPSAATLHAASGITGLGFVAEQKSNSLRVASLDQDLSPSESGLQVGDELTALGDKKITTRASLIRLLNDKRVGDEVTLTVLRGESTITTQVTLTRPRLIPPPSGIQSLDNLSFIPSVRRFGFEKTLVHSLPLNAWDCGSPLFDLSGNAIGINISASAASRSLALPPSVIEPAIARMLSSSDPF